MLPNDLNRKEGMTMKTTWTLQDAKRRFDAVMARALHDGPQYVTRKGGATVVIVSVKDDETLRSGKTDFKEFLLNSPKIDDDLLVFERQRDLPRSVEL